MADTTIEHTNTPDESSEGSTGFYEIQQATMDNEELLLPAVFTAKIRKRDRLIEPNTYRRPHHLQYIEYF
ncbi:MAG TPA: hypothetical protein VLE74_03365 [Candidatus Saccharimonadales bacterium]|nr:hypothetical protein [Candidatus Saccharimonadales bacterium]